MLLGHMARKLTIPRTHLAGFEKLRNVGAAGLGKIEAHLPPVMLLVKELEKALAAAEIPDPVAVAAVLFNLASLALDPSTNAFDDVSSALREARWSEEELLAWESMRPAVDRLLANNAIVTLAKAVQLQYDHTNILLDTHVVTDVRPVFDRDATHALAAIVCHSLRISYRAGGQVRHLTLAVDDADLKRLQRDAERAITKASTIHDFLEKPNPLPNRTAGGDDVS